MGGRVAQEVYRRAPDHVLKLALLATGYRGHANGEARAAEAARRDATIAQARAEGMESSARMWVRQAIAPANMDNTVLIEDTVAMMVRQTPEMLATQTLAGLMRSDHAEMLGCIACPTLICAGDRDMLRPADVHREMAARIPASHLAVIEGSAHMIAMERPDATTAAMRDWCYYESRPTRRSPRRPRCRRYRRPKAG